MFTEKKQIIQDLSIITSIRKKFFGVLVTLKSTSTQDRLKKIGTEIDGERYG